MLVRFQGMNFHAGGFLALVRYFADVFGWVGIAGLVVGRRRDGGSIRKTF